MTHKQSPLVLLFLFFLFFLVVYSPVLTFEFLYHDDVFFWFKASQWQGHNHYFFDILIGMGRYAAAYLATWEGWFVDRVADLAVLRLMGLFFLALSAGIVFRHLCCSSLPNIQSFLVTAGIFVLPGFQDIIFYAVGSFFTQAIFLSSLAFYLAFYKKCIVLSALLMLLAITIYPPAAMFFWVLMAIPFIFQDQERLIQQRVNMQWALKAGFLSLGLFAVLLFSVKHFIVRNALPPTTLYNPYLISTNFWLKLGWFLREPLVNALNLWSVYPKLLRGLIVAFIIIFALLWQKLRGVNYHGYGRPMAVVGLAVMSFLPNLFALENAPFYRCIIGLSALVWLVFVWAVKQWADRRSSAVARWVMIIFLSLAMLNAGVKAFKNLLYLRVLPSHIEWQSYKVMAQHIHFKERDVVLIVTPNHRWDVERYDEFGTLTSQYLEDIVPMLHCAFHEAGKDQEMPVLFLTLPDGDGVFELKDYYYRHISSTDVIAQEIGKEAWVHLDQALIDRYKAVLPQGIFGFLMDADLNFLPGNLYVNDLREMFSPHNYRFK